MIPAVLGAALAVSGGSASLVPIWTKPVPKYSEIFTTSDVVVTHEREHALVFDARSGEQIAEIPDCISVSVSGNTIVVVRPANDNTSVLEGWAAKPWKKQWEVEAADRYASGDLLGDYLFFGDSKGVHRYSLKLHAEEQLRPVLGSPYLRSVRATEQRVYVNYDGHTTMLLLPRDLNSGPMNYCDAWVSYADELGFVGTGTCGWNLAIIRPDAKNLVSYAKYILGGWMFNRVVPAVSEKYVILGGQLLEKYAGNGVRIISKYLLGLDRVTGETLWRVPLKTDNGSYLKGPALCMFVDTVALLGANTINGKMVWTLQLREAASGNLVWRSSPIDVEDNYAFLAKSDDNLFFANDGELTAYRFTRS